MSIKLKCKQYKVSVARFLQQHLSKLIKSSLLCILIWIVYKTTFFIINYKAPKNDCKIHIQVDYCYGKRDTLCFLFVKDLFYIRYADGLYLRESSIPKLEYGTNEFVLARNVCDFKVLDTITLTPMLTNNTKQQ